MQIVAPQYYKKFKCIAADCKHSCCVGWEIDIDADTLEIYKQVKGQWGERLKNSIAYDGETPHFITDKRGRCTFLNKNGLCDIITEFGEDGLCQICYDHPRFRNYFSHRVEIGLGLCCEAAAEIILSSNNSSLFVLESYTENTLPTHEERVALEQREALFNLFQNEEITLKDAMQSVIKKFGVNPFKQDLTQWVKKYAGLERLDLSWDEFLNKTEQKNFDFDYALAKAEEKILKAIRNLICYFIYRYFATEFLNNNPRGAINFIIQSTCFCLVVALSNYDDLNQKNFAEVCRMFSSEMEYSEENIELLLNSPTKITTYKNV